MRDSLLVLVAVDVLAPQLIQLRIDHISDTMFNHSRSHVQIKVRVLVLQWLDDGYGY